MPKPMLDQSTLNKRENNLVGLGGWLILFQLRLWLTVIQTASDVILISKTFTFNLGYLVFLGFVVSLIACIVLFYKRIMTFRTLYISTVFFSLMSLVVAYALMPIFDGIGYRALIVVVIESLIITALFRSRRVRQTFTSSKRETTPPESPV